MHHAAVAVVHQVACFAVDATGCDAVAVKEVRIHSRHFTVSPGRRKINQLQNTHVSDTTGDESKLNIDHEYEMSLTFI